MVKNLKLYQKVLALVLAAGITASGVAAGMKLHKTNEVNRVKGYLEDFTTESGYVDLSSISSTYNIKYFDGEYLRLAMEELDVDYVRITDSYIFNGFFKGIKTLPNVNLVFVDSSFKFKNELNGLLVCSNSCHNSTLYNYVC